MATLARIIVFTALFTQCVAAAAQYTLEPFLSDPYAIAKYALTDYCTQHNKQQSNNGVCFGKNANIDVCGGPGTSGSYNGLPNSAGSFTTQFRTVNNKTCVDGDGNVGIYLLPNELTSSIPVNVYKNFSLTLSAGSNTPSDNLFNLYFVNQQTNMLEPVNVTFYTIGGENNKVKTSGISVFYFRADDLPNGQPQNTLFSAFFQVQALNKLTVYSAGTYTLG